MSYFNNFPFVNYKFGNEAGATIFQNMGVYVDLIDQAKDNSSFYNYYNIQNGDRPDQVSQKLYNRTDLHWTFPIMNDNIKLQGWPLSYNDLVAKIKDNYPNKTLVTRADISDKFKVGSIITGSSTQTKAKILRKRLDLGQIIVGRVSVDNQITLTTDVKGYVKLQLSSPFQRFVELTDWIITKDGVTVGAPTIVSGGENHTYVEYNFGLANANTEYVFNTKVMNYADTLDFVDGEQITTTEDNVIQSAIIDSAVLEYYAVHHYEDVDGNYIDITPNAPFVQRTSYTFQLNYSTVNFANPDPVQLATDIYNATLASLVTNIEISSTSSYNSVIDLSNVQRNIDQGHYQLNGQILQLGAAIQSEVADTSSPTTALDIFTIWATELPIATSDPTFANHVFTELSTAWALSDKDAEGNATVQFHSFFIIDNQLNVAPDTGQFGQTFEYVVGGETLYKNTYGNSGTFTTTTPSPVTKNDAWNDIANQLESYIQQNLSSLVPANIIPVTYFDRHEKSNTALKSIRVLKPSTIEDIIKSFNDILIESQATNTGEQSSVNTVQSGTGSSVASTTSTGINITSSNSSSGGYY